LTCQPRQCCTRSRHASWRRARQGLPLPGCSDRRRRAVGVPCGASRSEGFVVVRMSSLRSMVRSLNRMRWGAAALRCRTILV
jgi:hypothetical protein